MSKAELLATILSAIEESETAVEACLVNDEGELTEAGVLLAREIAAALED